MRIKMASQIDQVKAILPEQLRGVLNFENLFQSSQREELDVPLLPVLIFSLALTVFIYITLLPFRALYLGKLLYDRGLTQHMAILLASIVIIFTILKFIKLRSELRALRRKQRNSDFYSEKDANADLCFFQERSDTEIDLLTTRCRRVLNAYNDSGSRKAAAEVALDDSSFYLNTSSTSYALPRILIWAIPLLGFIGTVIGISQAVTGFSGLLNGATEIEKLKEGIGSVTTGLAVAFDTTFLALLLSILVMIPLVLVERNEHRLLLGIDAYINDHLLSKFGEKQNELPFITEEIAQQLERAASAVNSQVNSLEGYVSSLESYTGKISEIVEVQQKTGENLIFSVGSEQLQKTLGEVRDNLDRLKPVLENLGRPRRVTLLENSQED